MAGIVLLEGVDYIAAVQGIDQQRVVWWERSSRECPGCVRADKISVVHHYH
jgi:hypothetical protein